MTRIVVDLGCEDALLLGGSADVQQFLKGDESEFLFAKARVGSETKDSAFQSQKPRDLGAALVLLQK
jgi:hypothetical protein